MAGALRTLGLTLCLALAGAGASTRAFAAPTPEQLQYARVLFAEAQKEERAGNWQSALEALRKVAAIKLTPGIRFHIALCEDKIGMLLEALADYEAAEREAQQQSTQDVLSAIKEPLAALRARIPRLTVNVPADIRDVRVTVDGTPLAASELGNAAPIAIGEHRIEATAPGRVAFKAMIAAKERETVVVHVILPAIRDPAAPPGVAPTPASSAHSAPPPQNGGAGATPPTDAAEPSSPSRPRTGALVATGASVVLLAGGFGAFAIAGGKQSDAEQACAGRIDCDDLKDGVRAWDTIALGAWIGAAAAATVAIVLWTRPSRASASSGRDVVLGPAGIGGSF
jgi:hypothetical protein